MRISNKRKKYFANKLHRSVFILLMTMSIVPALLVTVCLYYLIFSIIAQQMALPEGIAYYVIPSAKRVTFILLVAVPILLLVLFAIAYELTHTILGPYDRITSELDEIIDEKKEPHHIRLRKKDKFWPLVERINKLIDKIVKHTHPK